MKQETSRQARLMRPKIVTIGDGAVGKTSIVQRYIGKGFTENYIPTFGAEFHTYKKKYNLRGGPATFEWNLWDIAGQSRFKKVRKKYLLNTRAAIVVFDITRSITLKHTKKWVEEFYSSAREKSPFVLLGNKVDLRGTDEEEVPPEEGERLATELSEKYGIKVPYLETSAKTNKNLGKAFKLLATKIVERHQFSLSKEEETT